MFVRRAVRHPFLTGGTRMEVLVIALALFVLVINIAATVAVFRSPVPSSKQQLAQLAIVWLVPIFGAVLIGFFHYSIDSKETPQTSTLRDDNDYPAVNLSGRHGPSDT
jgi:NADH:ubiquinone oxidoreductase subunit 6 (subunit J)